MKVLYKGGHIRVAGQWQSEGYNYSTHKYLIIIISERWAPKLNLLQCPLKPQRPWKGQSKGKKINPKPLCMQPVWQPLWGWRGNPPLWRWLWSDLPPRYCAGISKAYYSQLCDKATPFVCLVCSQQMNIIAVQTLQKEIASLKKEIAARTYPSLAQLTVNANARRP